MKYKHVFSICAYKDSPYLEPLIRSLVSQSVPSHIILCTSTPSPYIDGLAWKYGIQVFVRHGGSNIRDDWNFAYEMADGGSWSPLHIRTTCTIKNMRSGFWQPAGRILT